MSTAIGPGCNQCGAPGVDMTPSPAHNAAKGQHACRANATTTVLDAPVAFVIVAIPGTTLPIAAPLTLPRPRHSRTQYRYPPYRHMHYSTRQRQPHRHRRHPPLHRTPSGNPTLPDPTFAPANALYRRKPHRLPLALIAVASTHPSWHFDDLGSHTGTSSPAISSHMSGGIYGPTLSRRFTSTTT